MTHHVEEIPAAFSHVLLLRGGRVVAAGPIADTLTEEALSDTFGMALRLESRARPVLRVRRLRSSPESPGRAAAMTEFVRLEIEGAVGVIRLDRPPVNAINTVIHRELLEIAGQVAGRPGDPGGRAVRRRARVRRRRGHQGDGRAQRGPRSLGPIGSLNDAVTAVARLPQPVIAAVTGYALGGGCELALAADFRVVAENAVLGLPEITLGVIPGAGGTQRLPRLVGVTMAKELIFTGRPVDGREAVRIGLASRAVPADRVLRRGAASGPPTGRRARPRRWPRRSGRSTTGLDGSLAAGLELETRRFAELFATEDQRIGMTSFLADGPGKATLRRSLTGRRPPWPTRSRLDDVRFLRQRARATMRWPWPPALPLTDATLLPRPDPAARDGSASGPRPSPRRSGSAGGRWRSWGRGRGRGCSPTRRCSRRPRPPVAAHRGAAAGRTSACTT